MVQDSRSKKQENRDKKSGAVSRGNHESEIVNRELGLGLKGTQLSALGRKGGKVKGGQVKGERVPLRHGSTEH